jgi:hypothetical protein
MKKELFAGGASIEFSAGLFHRRRQQGWVNELRHKIRTLFLKYGYLSSILYII